MTKEQVKHFMDNGIFSAIYNPVRTDDFIDTKISLHVNKEVLVHRNWEITPVSGGVFKNDYRFFMQNNSNFGWIPESELVDLKIIDKFEPNLTRSNSVHQYKMMVQSRKKAIDNFGNYGNDCKLPVISFREYTKRMDGYVRSICKPEHDGLWYRKYPSKKWVKI